MRKLVCSLGLTAVIGTAAAGEMLLVSDEELDSIYAQFGHAGDAVISNTGTLASIINNSLPLYASSKNGTTDDPGSSVTVAFPDQLGLNGQIIIDGSAQENAFNPINAVNSAVSNVYNIFIVIESSWENVEVNIENAVNAVNNSNIAGGAY